jgi:hypothetical protein
MARWLPVFNKTTTILVLKNSKEAICYDKTPTSQLALPVSLCWFVRRTDGVVSWRHTSRMESHRIQLDMHNALFRGHQQTQFFGKAASTMMEAQRMTGIRNKLNMPHLQCLFLHVHVDLSDEEWPVASGSSQARPSRAQKKG